MDAKRHVLPRVLSRGSLLLGAVLLTAAARPPLRVTARLQGAVPVPRGEGLLRQVMLGAHARARGELGLPPLAWSDALAASARRYAQVMAQTGRFAHDHQADGGDPQGENLFAGTRDAYPYDEAVRLWIAEKRDFTNGVAPAFSRTGRWQDVPHYAQIVWRTTRQVGCAMVSGATDDYLVCRYYPAGNVLGQRAY